MTIKEVAEKAKVSIGTVDRVVHGRGRVSKKTEELIKKIIDESGYKPNIFARRLSLSKTFNFAVLMPEPSQDSKYWELSVKGIERALEELRAYKVKVKYFFFDRYSEASAKEVIKKIRLSETDGVLIAPVLHKPIKKFIEDILDSVPYVLFNANIPDSNAVSYIGQDSFQSGVVSAKLMRMMIREKGSLAVILAAPDDYHIWERSEGFVSFLEEYPEIAVRNYEVRPCEGDAFTCVMDQIFEENKDLNGIFVANAATHYAAEYLKKRKNGTKIPLVGYDLIEENVAMLKEGWIDFLISQRAETQGYEGIYALYRHAVLQDPGKNYIMMPLDIIMKENLIYYQKF